MFVFNMHINSKNVKKYLLIAIMLILLIFLFFVLYNFLYKPFSFFKVNDEINTTDYEIASSNYTNVLRIVHENVSEYVGQQIKFTGYVYRVYDFNDNQFVLARDMVVASNFQTVVVGFLCEFNDSSSFADGTWVEVDGIIQEGNYHRFYSYNSSKKYYCC